MATKSMLVRMPVELMKRLEHEKETNGVDKTWQITKALKEHFRAKDEAELNKLLEPTPLEKEHDKMFGLEASYNVG